MELEGRVEDEGRVRSEGGSEIEGERVVDDLTLGGFKHEGVPFYLIAHVRECVVEE